MLGQTETAQLVNILIDIVQPAELNAFAKSSDPGWASFTRAQ
jgi:hypothetical protein